MHPIGEPRVGIFFMSEFKAVSITAAAYTGRAISAYIKLLIASSVASQLAPA